jgi:hypothetical protein
MKKSQKRKQRFYIILSVVLLILLILTNKYAPGNGHNYDDLKKNGLSKQQEEQIKPTPTAIIKKVNYDQNAFVILNEKLAFDFQNTASFEKTSNKQIRLNNIIYNIEANAFSNLCSMDDSTYKCDYQDSNLENVKTIRLWRENRNVFAFHALKVEFKGEELDNIVITKDTQVNYFSEQEIEMWKEIFNKKLTVLK